jgi:hypothetical protein
LFPLLGVLLPDSSLSVSSHITSFFDVMLSISLMNLNQVMEVEIRA